ncbi:MAG: ABC transporter permease [Candidatus Bipolaricaulia bacterium]
MAQQIRMRSRKTKSAFRLPIQAVSYRTFFVWRRDFDTFLRLWKTMSWPMFVEPVLFIVAMGFGLGRFVTDIDGLSFLQFIAPGFIATSIMFTTSYECTFGSFVRMEFQRTFDAIIATPVNIEEVIAGDMLWGATRGLFAAVGVTTVISAFGLVQSPWAILIPIVAVLQGLMFASIAMVTTALVPAIDAFTYYFTLGITPMFLFSGVFFPIDRLPETVQWLAWIFPLTHAVNLHRGLALGNVSWGLLGDFIWIVVAILIAFNVALALMRRRLIK